MDLGGAPSNKTSSQLTEFLVKMESEECVSAIREKLEPLEGVKVVEFDRPNNLVRVEGTASLKSLKQALRKTGRKARFIGQGVPNYIPNAVAMAEFKGPEIYGVVWILQLNMTMAQINATFSGLSEGPHGWSINEFGDLSQGAASTGKIYNPPSSVELNELTGDLGVLFADATGKAEYGAYKEMLTVADLPGRSVVVYDNERKYEVGIAATVITRSAGIGENYKRKCICDNGSVISQFTNHDFVGN